MMSVWTAATPCVGLSNRCSGPVVLLDVRLKNANSCSVHIKSTVVCMHRDCVGGKRVLREVFGPETVFA
jgi:hypothetical protein